VLNYHRLKVDILGSLLGGNALFPIAGFIAQTFFEMFFSSLLSAANMITSILI